MGRTREHNEDAFVVADLTRGNATLQPEVRTHEVGDRGTLFMVADGMGGAAAGEIASAMAIEVVLQELSDALTAADAPDKETYATGLKRATATANSQIHNFALEHPEYRGMGTTATIAAVLADTLFLAQVGDSRAYLVRGGVAMQITKDQSLMQKLIEAGEITEEEAEQSERRNIILQALGPEAQIRIDLTHQQLRSNDTLIICSDGLSGQVRIDEIARVVTEEPDLIAVCKRLIERANENGGPDNITVIAARFEGDGLIAPESGDNVGHSVFPLDGDSGQTPAAPIRAVDPSDVPTRELPADTRRSTLKLPSLELPFSGLDTRPQVSPTRRLRGSLIALALVIVFLALATWWTYRAAEKLAPKVGETSAPVTPKPKP
ncbi:MAG: Stp1/IreP family PP2C-type Ser/Thr phosphatase [bacterium]